MLKTTFFAYLLFICCLYFPLSAQNSHSGNEDTTIVKQYIQKARESINQSFDSALLYSEKAIQISKKIGYKNGIAWGYHRISQVYDFSGSCDSAIKYAHLAEKYFLDTGDSTGLAYSLYTSGNIYLYKTWYKTSLEYYFKAHEVFQRKNNLSGMYDCYAGIGLIYFFSKDWRKSIYYFSITAKHEEDTNDEEGLPETYFNIGCAYYELGLNDTAAYYYKLAEKIADKTNNSRVLTAVYNNLGEIEKDERHFSAAINYLTESIALKNQLEYNEGLGENYINLASVYLELEDYNNAFLYINKGIEYCKQFSTTEDLASGYQLLSRLYEKTRDHAGALSAYKEYMKVNDTLIIKKYNEQVAEWQTLYQLKEKEFQLETAKNKLSVQNAVIQKNRMIQFSLITLVALIITGSVLLYRNIRNKNIIARQKNELQEHKIKQLENEKMLLATQSVLKGEEIERRRLARDLHDGIGGLLSGVKIAFGNIKGNMVLTSENVNEFNNALGLLDASITELRRVARNMLPETLLKLGLRDSVSDFCAELNKINPVNIIFQFYGSFERVDPNLEINAFRVVQELVSNAIKHAQAKELVVQMLQEPGRLCLIVQDDGTGFDIYKAVSAKGIGLTAIKSRVDSLNGKMEMISSPGEGAEFIIEFPV